MMTQLDCEEDRGPGDNQMALIRTLGFHSQWGGWDRATGREHGHMQRPWVGGPVGVLVNEECW